MYKGILIYPFIYAIMDRKTTSAYVEVFKYLQKVLKNTVITKCMSDYENGLRLALRTVFPNIILRGCYFHFAKCIFEMSLALLPQSEIQKGIQIIKEHIGNSPEAIRLINYIEGQWNRNIDISVFNDIIRTNNACESLHSTFSSLIGLKHPNIFVFLQFLQNVDEKSYCDLFREINNINAPRSRRVNYEHNDLIISKAQKLLKNNGDVLLFLKTVSIRNKGNNCKFYN